jgi:drug/metabolite transporter (DMT)-like permease
MVGSAACWGGATAMTKAALSELPPFTLLAVQLAASVAVLWTAVAVGGRTPPRGCALRAAAPGLLEPGLAYGLGVPGLALTSAAAATVVGAAEPAFICLAAWILLGQRPAPGTWAALAAAAAGVALTAAPSDDGGRLVGDALVAAGTAAAALYVVLSSRDVARLDPLPLAALQQTAGLAAALALLAAAVLTGAERPPPDPGAGALLLAAASGVVQYALAFWLYLVGLRTLPPGEAGMFLALVPVFGVAAAVLLLGERPTAAQLAGCALVAAAVIAIVRRG